MYYRLLGQLEVVTEDGRVVAFGGEKERVALATLLLAANRPVSTDRLIDALWGERPPQRAANALQAHMSRVRKKLGAAVEQAGVLRTEPSGYQLTVGPGELDVEHFERLVSQPDGPPAEVSSRLNESLSLWRGPALADVDSDSLRGEGVRLEELRWSALERRIDADLVLGRHHTLVAELQALVAEQPLRDSFTRQLMLALYRSGRPGESVAVYRHTQKVWADELGIDVSPSLQRLELAILTQAPDLDEPPGVPTSADFRVAVFLFTDIEGSTRLWAEHPAEMGKALARHDVVLAEAVDGAGGIVFKHTGDGVCSVFPSVSNAIAAAAAAQRGLASHYWGSIGVVRARMAVHAGDAEQRDGDWFGPALNRTVRLLEIAHGGQVLLSGSAHELAPDDLPELFSFQDLGFHRSRDLSSPEHVWQLMGDGLERRFPPLRSFDANRGLLPAQTTSFIGRKTEIDAISSELSVARLVTLVGPGGVGKTRLAAQIGAGLVDKFPDGVWMFELAALDRPDGLEATMLATLGRASVAVEAPRQELLEAVRSWRALLIVDNCEHLLRPVAPVVRDLLAAGDDLTVLATSREPLHLPGEQVVAVAPLPIRDDSVALFMDRAGSLRHTFQSGTETRDVVARICEQLDGVPLAIELAAARTVALTPQEIERRLGQRLRLLTNRSADPDRHRSLRHVLDWSYDLLDDHTAAFFCRLCVFVGSFDLQAAHSVCGADDEFATLDMLADLVDKSLLTARPLGDWTSYRLLETMRQYGRLRLDDPDYSRLLNTHAAYFADLVERSWEGVRGRHSQDWLDRLDEQFANVRAAFEKAIHDGDVDLAVRISGGLFPYAFERRRAEMSRWIELTVTLPGVEQHQMAPRLHLHRGFALTRAGDLETANAELRRVLDGEGPDFDSLKPTALHLMAMVASCQGSLDALERLGRQSLEECRRLGDDYDYDRAEALFCVCGAAVFRGMPESAPTREYLELGRKLGKGRALSGALLWSGVAEPDHTTSIALLSEAAAESQRPWESYWYVTAIAWLGVIQSADDPLAALRAIPTLLDYAQSTGDYLILVLRSVDFLSPLAALGRHRDVAVLDGVTGFTSFTSLRPELAALGRSVARSALGDEPYAALNALGKSFSASDLASFLARLRAELDEAQ